MPFYQQLDPKTPEGQRTLKGLLTLRGKLQEQIPVKSLEGNLLLATWNIREFGTPKYGGRTREAFYYIAEIIARFDIIAIQEVREDLSALDTLMQILGSNWQYIFTDVTEGSQGNGERLAFVFDTRKVKFGGLAGELVLPPFQTKDPATGQTVYQPITQLARTPYLAGFKAGWTNFLLTTVHILYGTAAANDPDRIAEIAAVAKAIGKKADNKLEWSHNLLLLGDFNIYSPKDSTLKAITDAGFIIPKQLQSLPSNVQQNKFYDQVAFKVKPNRFEPTGKAGIFNYYQWVFREEDEKEYITAMGEDYNITSDGEPRQNKTAYYKIYWRTFQMSDHLPMWVEIAIDHTDAYLKEKLLPPQESEAATPAAPAKKATAKKV